MLCCPGSWRTHRAASSRDPSPEESWWQSARLPWHTDKLSRFADDLCTTAWKASAGALLKEIADCPRTTGWQRAGARTGTGAADIEEPVQLTCAGSFTRSPNAWFANGSDSGLPTQRASANAR